VRPLSAVARRKRAMSGYSSDSPVSDEEENESDYRKGGYHPVYIGETFKDGRYKVDLSTGKFEHSLYPAMSFETPSYYFTKKEQNEYLDEMINTESISFIILDSPNGMKRLFIQFNRSINF
jgi:hypothetical protein